MLQTEMNTLKQHLESTTMLAKNGQNKRAYTENIFTHLLQGSHFLYHEFDVLMVLLPGIILTLLFLPVTAAWQVGLDEYGLCSSDTATTVRAGVAGRLLLERHQ